MDAAAVAGARLGGALWLRLGRRRPTSRARRRQASPERVIIRVAYLPISHVAPRSGEQATAIPPRVARHLGLTEERSHLYTSYAVEDDWPYDVAHAPGSGDRFDYGFVPPRLFEAVASAFAAHLAAYPGFVHEP